MSSIISWEEPGRTACVVLLGNLIQIAFYFNVPIFTYAVAYGAFILLGLGAICRLLKSKFWMLFVDC